MMPANLQSAGSWPDGVSRFQLSNGLTLVARPLPSVPVVSSALWYRVGSRCETSGTRGLSHFLEHMLFKGSRRYPKGEIDCITARQGGMNNAFTSYDYTAYYFAFAADRWWPALEMEADRMVNNRFDPEEFESERQVIMEELRMEMDSPWGALAQAVEARAYQVHPYRFPVIGTRDDLCSLRLDQMVDYYRRFYVPSNATLVLVGNFQLEAARRRVEALFGSLAPGEPSRPASFDEPFRPHAEQVEVRRPGRVPRLLLTFPAPSVCQSEHFGLQLLDRILAQGRLSRLHRRLVEQEQVASFVTTEYSETLDPHLIQVRVELREGEDPERIEEMVFQEIARLAETAVKETELRRAKNQCATETLASFETALDQALQLGLMETLVGHEYWTRYLGNIEQVTPEALRALVERFCRPERATVGRLIPTA